MVRCAICCELKSFLGRPPFRQLLLLAALGVVLIFTVTGCEKREAGQSLLSKQSVAVSVITVEPRNVPVSAEYIAQVQSSRQVNIQARVNGFLEKRMYTEGSIVKAGQTLFLMDQKPFKVQLDLAKAVLARQEASLTVARQNLARVKPLAAANALSQKDLDDATGKFLSAAAAVEQAKARVEQAKLNLSYTVITSPVTGISSSAQVADGTYLSYSNSQLTTVSVISPVYVNFSLSENDWLQYRDLIAKKLLIEPKNREYVAQVILADGSIYPYTGKVTFAAPSFNAKTGTFLLRVTVANPDGLLHPNQYVRVRLKGAFLPHAILVPQRAVQESAKGHFVWVVDKQNKAELRPVMVGQWQGNAWVIQQGLHAGDEVVVDGTLTLRSGTPVKVTFLTDKEGKNDTSSLGNGTKEPGH